MTYFFAPTQTQNIRLKLYKCIYLFHFLYKVLHLWLEALASNEEVVSKWYHPWSFMSSPGQNLSPIFLTTFLDSDFTSKLVKKLIYFVAGWVQIKCELRLLSKFSFNLNPEWELDGKKDEAQPIQEGVKDMLITHHLFSWDL